MITKISVSLSDHRTVNTWAMHPLRLVILLSLAIFTSHVDASPEKALLLRKTWQTTVDAWTIKCRAATTQQALDQVRAERPDAADYAGKMWALIGNSLDQDWTIEPAAWFLVITQGLPATVADRNIDSPRLGPPTKEIHYTPAFSKEINAIRSAILTHHLQSPKVMPICMALASLNDPLSLNILEKIQSINPDTKIQGVAALAAAIVLKNLGDDPDLIRKRLTYLRKSIIESADVELGNSTVANLAENELYHIQFLSKGRVAPDLSGVDSKGLPIKLSDFKNQVIVLIFWSSTLPQADQTMEITANMVKKFAGKPIAVIGVNHDSIEKLKVMESNGSVTWRNFSDPKYTISKDYRVSSWPTVYVLDQKRQVQYAGPQGTFVEFTAEALAVSK
jgi:peroxiredoxin